MRQTSKDGAASVERDGTYCKQLLRASGVERGAGGERFLHCPVQLNSRTKLKLYCIVSCLFIYGPFDDVISSSECKES